MSTWLSSEVQQVLEGASHEKHISEWIIWDKAAAWRPQQDFRKVNKPTEEAIKRFVGSVKALGVQRKWSTPPESTEIGNWIVCPAHGALC